MKQLKGVFMKAVNNWVFEPVQSMREMEFPRPETLQKIADAVLTLGISAIKSPVKPQYAVATRITKSPRKTL